MSESYDKFLRDFCSMYQVQVNTVFTKFSKGIHGKNMHEFTIRICTNWHEIISIR